MIIFYLTNQAQLVDLFLLSVKVHHSEFALLPAKYDQLTYYIFAPAMTIQLLKSKIHRVRITESNIDYVGSITIDQELMDAAKLIENEKVQIVNVNNGERLNTYVIRGAPGSGVISLNGPAARKGLVGDIVIVISYCTIDFEEARSFKPTIIFPDGHNRLTSRD